MTTLIEKDPPGPALLLIFVVLLLLLLGSGLGFAYMMGAFGGHTAEMNTQTITPPLTLPGPAAP